MEKKVADQLVDMLAEAGIKRIYAVTGDSLNELNRAIKKQGKIQWIHVRNEVKLQLCLNKLQECYKGLFRMLNQKEG